MKNKGIGSNSISPKGKKSTKETDQEEINKVSSHFCMPTNIEKRI